MRLVVGLGNPGREYEMTRHNLGFMVIDKLFERTGARRFRSQFDALIAEVSLAGERVLLAKPKTFMNLSGDSVRLLLSRYGEGDVRNLIATSDDIALPFGMIRVRAGGSAGGQKGLRSIIERVGSHQFPRVRVGIKPNHPVTDLSDFVLEPVPKLDREELDRVLERAADAIETIITSGVERAMQLFNERVRAVTSEE